MCKLNVRNLGCVKGVREAEKEDPLRIIQVLGEFFVCETPMSSHHA